MAYIGPLPAETFTSFATQEFSTSATTSYTLDHPVTNENELALFINNVRQQPGSGKAYTAVGTALTLSAATASTDTMYAVFLGRALQTVNPADASVGTSQLAATSVTAAKLNNDIISGQTALGATPADTDELLVSDAGTIKRVDFSHIKSDPGFKLISRQQVSSVSSVDFNQVMTTDHYQYIFFLEGVQPTASANLLLQFQTSDESSGAYDTGTNYNHTAMRNNDGNSVAQTGQSALQLSRDGAGHSSSNRLYSGQINIANASSTTDHKMVYHFGGGRQQDGTFSGQLMFGTYEDTARLTGAKFTFDSGNFAAKGFISLYGLATS